jgi:hypothetical protein
MYQLVLKMKASKLSVFTSFFQAAAQQTVCSTCYGPASTSFKYEVKIMASLVSFFEAVAQLIHYYFTV